MNLGPVELLVVVAIAIGPLARFLCGLPGALLAVYYLAVTRRKPAAATAGAA